MFEICLEFNAFHRYTARKEHVHELAVSGARAQLLNLCEIGLQTLIYPQQHIMPGQIVRRHVSRIHVHCHHDAPATDEAFYLQCSLRQHSMYGPRL